MNSKDCGGPNSSKGFNNTKAPQNSKKQVQGRKITNLFQDNDINQTI